MKTEIKSDDNEFTYIQYEIYNPNTLEILNLDICKNLFISINSPIILSSDIEYLYNSLNKSGYNLFNSNDSFYKDICSPYTSENGTDVPMEDRQNKLFNDINNKSLCQNNCKFVYYNITSKKSKCDCDIQNETIKTNINVTQMILNNKVVLSFIKTLKHSNFIVLKCFKLFLSLNGQKRNIGIYIMTIIFFLLIVSMIIYFIKEKKKISIFINQIIRQRFGEKQNYNYLKDDNRIKSDFNINLKKDKKTKKNIKEIYK